MARTFTVTVTDDTGKIVRSKRVNADGYRNHDIEHLDDVEYVLLVAAPESCPFDCDYCRD